MEFKTGPPPSTDGLWTARDVARYLRVSQSWCYRAAESGLLPHRRIGALLRFVPDEVKAFVDPAANRK